MRRCITGPAKCSIGLTSLRKRTASTTAGGSESDYAFFNPISPYHGYVDSATINAVISGDTTDSRLGQVVSCQVTAVEFQDGSKWKLETSK
jgi:hypothetical protein